MYATITSGTDHERWASLYRSIMDEAFMFEVPGLITADTNAKLRRMNSVVEQYITSHAGESELYSAVRKVIDTTRLRHHPYQERVIDAMADFFSSGVSPVYILASLRPFAAAFKDIPSGTNNEVMKAKAIAALRDILLAEQQRIATPELPVEIIKELICTRVDDALKEVIER